MKLIALTQVFLSAGMVTAQMLAKPAIQPPPDAEAISAKLNQVLPLPQHEVHVNYYRIPEFCYNQARDRSIDTAKVRMVNVTYADCPGKPWLLCHHTEADITTDEFVAIFGRIPVQARSATKHWMALPGDACHGVTYGSQNTITFSHCDLHAFLHENTHANDLYGFPTASRTLGSASNGLFSATNMWRGAYDQDSAVVTEYARTNFVEDFAAVSGVAVYDANVQGGAGPIVPQLARIRHAVDTFTGFVRQVKPGGTCPYRHANDALVSNGFGSGKRV